MQYVMAFHVASLIQYKGLSLQKACAYLLAAMKKAKGDVGLIATAVNGNMLSGSHQIECIVATEHPMIFVAVYPE